MVVCYIDTGLLDIGDKVPKLRRLLGFFMETTSIHHEVTLNVLTRYMILGSLQTTARFSGSTYNLETRIIYDVINTKPSCGASDRSYLPLGHTTLYYRLLHVPKRG